MIITSCGEGSGRRVRRDLTERLERNALYTSCDESPWENDTGTNKTLARYTDFEFIRGAKWRTV